MDFHLPPLCPVSLGFSFNLKRIGRRRRGFGGGEGGWRSMGDGEEQKVAPLCCCSEITSNWDPLAARVWYTSQKTCQTFREQRHLISMAKNLKISRRRLIKPPAQPLWKLCVCLFCWEGQANELPDPKTSVTAFGSMRRTVREGRNVDSNRYEGIQQKEWRGFS